MSLGVGADVVETFADLNPWFSGGHLWVSGEWEGNKQLEEHLSSVILYLLRLKRWLKEHGLAPSAEPPSPTGGKD